MQGCSKSTRAKGLCGAHYERMRRDGTLEYVKGPLDRSGDDAENKLCSKCIERKPRTEFFRSSRNLDGSREWCKSCMKECNDADYVANREVRLEVMAARAATPEYKANRAIWFQRHYELNRHSYAAAAHKRRALIAMAHVDDGITISELRNRHGDRCAFCRQELLFEGGNEYDQDRASMEHMTPLSRGGKHSWENVRLSCWGCNLSKNAKTADEFIEWVARL